MLSLWHGIGHFVYKGVFSASYIGTFVALLKVYANGSHFWLVEVI